MQGQSEGLRLSWAVLLEDMYFQAIGAIAELQAQRCEAGPGPRREGAQGEEQRIGPARGKMQALPAGGMDGVDPAQQAGAGTLLEHSLACPERVGRGLRPQPQQGATPAQPAIQPGGGGQVRRIDQDREPPSRARMQQRGAQQLDFTGTGVRRQQFYERPQRPATPEEMAVELRMARGNRVPGGHHPLRGPP